MPGPEELEKYDSDEVVYYDPVSMDEEERAGLINALRDAEKMLKEASPMSEFQEQHVQFVNESDLEFKSIDTEQSRTYSFAHPTLPDRFIDVTIDEPLMIHVSESGGHRIFCTDGNMYYVPTGWVLLQWTPKEGQATVNF